MVPAIGEVGIHLDDSAIVSGVRVAIGETVILLTLPLAFSRCFNRHREGVSAE